MPGGFLPDMPWQAGLTICAQSQPTLFRMINRVIIISFCIDNRTKPEYLYNFFYLCSNNKRVG